MYLLSDDEYNRLLDEAFSKMPQRSAEKSDFVIPEADVLIQGNKTMVRNAALIADKARRKPQEIARYLSGELGVPIDVEDQRFLINGRFTNSEIDRRIKRFFEIYVVCKECHKPDSHLEVAGRGMSIFVCEACGARYGVKSY